MSIVHPEEQKMKKVFVVLYRLDVTLPLKEPAAFSKNGCIDVFSGLDNEVCRSDGVFGFLNPAAVAFEPLNPTFFLWRMF